MKHILACLAITASLSIPSLLSAQTAGSVRDVQIRSIDLVAQTLELRNFGSTTRPLDGWRFCSHDEVDGFDYTGSSGLNGQSILAGESLFIHWNNDASAANEINLSSLGGAAVDDLSVAAVGDAIQIGLYTTSPFSSSGNLVDHLQYSFNGVDVNGADVRGTVAESAGLWTDQNLWISVDSNSTEVVLAADPFPGAGSAHGPGSYSITAVPEPTAIVFLAIGGLGLASRRRRS